RDAVVGIPVEIIEHDLGQAHLAGKHRREHDAVVVAVRLGAEDGDVVLLGHVLEQFFQGLHPGHAVADHYQFLFAHDFPSQQRSDAWPEHDSMSSGIGADPRAALAVRKSGLPWPGCFGMTDSCGCRGFATLRRASLIRIYASTVPAHRGAHHPETVARGGRQARKCRQRVWPRGQSSDPVSISCKVRAPLRVVRTLRCTMKDRRGVQRGGIWEACPADQRAISSAMRSAARPIASTTSATAVPAARSRASKRWPATMCRVLPCARRTSMRITASGRPLRYSLWKARSSVSSSKSANRLRSSVLT